MSKYTTLRKSGPFKWTLTAVAAVTLVLGAALLYARWQPPQVPDWDRLTPEKAVAFMSQENFNRLSTQQRLEFGNQLFAKMSEAPPENRRELLSGATLSDPQKERLRDNRRLLFRERRLEQARQYRQLPSDQREAFLDSVLDQRPGRRSFRRGGNRGDRSVGRGDRGRGSSRRRDPAAFENRIRHRIAESDPSDRAMMLQFRKALRERRRQRNSS